MSKTRLGFKHSEDTKKLMSKLAKGKNTWAKGSKMSDEFRQKIKQSWVIRKQKIHLK